MRIAAIVALLAFAQCESKKESPLDSILLNARCDLLTDCPSGGAKFGMVGDSWTDLAAGLPLQRDLHDWLIDGYGYRVQAFVLAGHTAEAELNLLRGFDRVIRNGGPELKYMLISLGGNDLLANNRAYWTNGVDAELDTRLARLDVTHRQIIAQGNYIKQTLYGGDPLVWFINGYDYPNPNLENSCVRGSLNAGMPVSQAAQQTARMIDRYQTYLQGLTSRVTGLHIVDLRGTLGGPNESLVSLKLDCIHPNSAGFGLLAARYVASIEQVTVER